MPFLPLFSENPSSLLWGPFLYLVAYIIVLKIFYLKLMTKHINAYVSKHSNAMYTQHPTQEPGFHKITGGSVLLISF